MTTNNGSTRQGAVLAYIRRYIVMNGRGPTVREIGRAVGITTTSQVIYYLKKLAKEGCLAREFNIARGIQLPDALTVFVGDEVLVEVDGALVRGRVVEPVARAA